MPAIRLQGVPGLDGEYPFDPADMNMGDYMTIDRIAGVSVLELEDALARGKAGLFVALAAVALKKAGKTFNEEQILEAPMGAVTFVGDDAVPLATATPTTGDGTTPTTGDGSASDSGLYPVNVPKATGTPA